MQSREGSGSTPAAALAADPKREPYLALPLSQHPYIAKLDFVIRLALKSYYPAKMCRVVRVEQRRAVQHHHVVVAGGCDVVIVPLIRPNLCGWRLHRSHQTPGVIAGRL